MLIEIVENILSKCIENGYEIKKKLYLAAECAIEGAGEAFGETKFALIWKEYEKTLVPLLGRVKFCSTKPIADKRAK